MWLVRLGRRCAAPASAPTAATASVGGCAWFLASNRMADVSRIEACWRWPGIAGVIPLARAGFGAPVASLAVRPRTPGVGLLPRRDAGVSSGR